MDISKLDSGVAALEDGVPIPIKNAAGKPTDIKFRIRSFESEPVKRVQRAFAEAVRRERRSDPNYTPTVEENEKLVLDMLCATVVSWSGIESGGKPLEFTPDNLRMVLDKFPFIRRQVDRAAGDEARFFTAKSEDSAKPSASGSSTTTPETTAQPSESTSRPLA